MAQEGSACTSALQPAAVERSAATPRNSAFGMLALTPAMARSTSACVSPLTTTVAPHSARPRAMAKPIPPVEPVTIAVTPERSIFIRHSPVEVVIIRGHAEERGRFTTGRLLAVKVGTDGDEGGIGIELEFDGAACALSRVLLGHMVSFLFNWRSASAGSRRRQSKLHHSPADNFSRSQQVEIFIDLVEREHLQGVADPFLSSERHALAQVGVVAPERAMKGLFARNPREQRDIDAVSD